MVFDFVEGPCLRDLISSKELSVAQVELILFNLLWGYALDSRSYYI